MEGTLKDTNKEGSLLKEEVLCIWICIEGDGRKKKRGEEGGGRRELDFGMKETRAWGGKPREGEGRGRAKGGRRGKGKEWLGDGEWGSELPRKGS